MRLKNLLTFLVLLTVSVGTWADNAVIRYDETVSPVTLTIETKDDPGLSGSITEWATYSYGTFNRTGWNLISGTTYASIIIKGSISQTGLNYINTNAGNKTNLPLDLSQATQSGSWTSFPSQIGSITFAANTTLPYPALISSSNVKYAYSPAGTSANIYVATGTSLSDISELSNDVISSLASNSTTINLCGDGAEALKSELINAGLSQDQINVSIPFVFDGNLDVEGENIENDIAEMMSEHEEVTLAGITSLTVTGTLTATDIDWIKSNLPNLTSIDLSGATLADGLDYSSFPTSLTKIILPDGTDSFPDLSAITNLKVAVATGSNNNYNVLVNNTTPGSLNVSDLSEYNVAGTKVSVRGSINTSDVQTLKAGFSNSTFFDFSDATGVTGAEIATKLFPDSSPNPISCVMPNGTDLSDITWKSTQNNLYAFNATKTELSIYSSNTDESDIDEAASLLTNETKSINFKSINNKVNSTAVTALSHYTTIENLNLSQNGYDANNPTTNLSALNSSSLKYITLPHNQNPEDYTVSSNIAVVASYNTSTQTGYNKMYQAGTLSGAAAYANANVDVATSMRFTGNMNAADLEAIAEARSVTTLDLEGVTLAEGVDALTSLSSSTIEYLRLPNGIEFSSITNPVPNCTSLKAVLSTDASYTTAYAHVTGTDNTTNNRGALSTLTSNALLNTGLSTLATWTISGYLQNSDVRNKDIKLKNITGANVDDGQGFGALPAGVITSIDLTNAVFDCDELTVNNISGSLLSSVKFPDNNLTCKAIPAYCANLCTGLTSAEIPSTYTAIGAHAFHQTAITRIKIGKNVTSVGDHAFTLCNDLNTVEFEKGIHDLNFEAYSFAGITGLKHVVLPEGVSNLGEYMFEGCPSLESVRLPSTLQNIAGHCFEGCAKLKQIAIPAGVKTIGRNAFSNSGLRDIYLMASTVDEIPLIYPFTNDPSSQSYTQSTFARNKLVSNNQDIGKSKDEVADMTTEEVHELYHSLNNIPAFLHYNPALRDFIDYNPNYPGTDSRKEGSPAEEKYITDTYVFEDKDGQHWPKQNDGSYRGDYVRILEAGLIDNTTVEGQKTPTGLENMTRFAWRQFMLKFGDAEPGKTVYEKKLKDVWYTMCFPYDLTDEQLEEFLTAEYNICEFSGVEVTENTGDDGSVSKSLILHFNDIASELVIHDDPDDTKDVKYLAYAGHPYMIHPNIGTVNENVEGVEGYDPSVVCYIPGVKDLSVDKEGNKVDGYQPGQSREQVIFDGSTKTLTCYQDQTVMKDGEVFTYTDNQGAEHTNMTFRFIGTYDKVLIPYGAYFLGTKKGDIYPKYWRENSKDQNRNTGWWNQYTAIVLPDADTESWLRTVSENGDGNVKSMDISFNDWDATIIPDALNIETVKDGQSENKTKVEFYNIVYDFNGNIVKKGDASIENLPTGMYIVNGKKYFVK